MVRGFVYSFLAISVCLFGSIIWFALTDQTDAELRLGIWILLGCFFLVGPLFFGLGYWHHRRLFPREPHWDAETGE
jgi:hypothetical protein